MMKSKSKGLNEVIDKCASHIRSTIKESTLPTPWPMHPAGMKNCGLTSVPKPLERFLSCLLTGDPDVKDQSQRVGTLVQSFSQDLIYAVTCGKSKPPKHLFLPNAVKTLTGNIELIQILNKLGHGISYSQLEENDTALCLQKLACSSNQSVLLPASIKPYVFTNLAWDNIDRLEETLTGKGTSHRVNGIAVQAKVYGPDLPGIQLPRVDKQKQRTVTVDQEELRVYVSGARVGPQPSQTFENTLEAVQASKSARISNFIWVLCRLLHSETQLVPSWTGFNIRIRAEELVPEDTVGYLPTINAPATDLSTVYEILNQSEMIRKELLLEAIVVVMDQALYAKATEIHWKHTDRFANVILRMGTFHTICNALSIIGKRFRDAGLKDLCIESGIVAEGSINGVLDGKHYKRAVTVHKYVYEALMRLAWIEFMTWLEEHSEEKAEQVKSFLDEVKTVSCDIDQDHFTTLTRSNELDYLFAMWKDFLEHLRLSNGELSSFWMSYVDFVDDVILGLIRGSREGNWSLHLNAVRSLIPWCFAYDKLNYARYLSPYYAQMSSLEEKHPRVYEAFCAGQFSVQLSSTNPFGRIPVDQTTEVTVNKDTQTPRGTARFSLNAAAIKRYYITAEYRSAFLGQLRGMVGGTRSEGSHTDLSNSRIKKDEESVDSVTSLFKEWGNPFSDKQTLVSVSTARVAPKEVASDLLNARQIGEKAYGIFKQERLEKDPPDKKFHDPMKTQRRKTFSNLTKQKEIKSGGRMTIPKADRTLFGRIIVMAQGCNLQMEEILSHPLGPLPWALSTPDGFLRKTNKAALATTLQKDVDVAEELPGNSASMIDGMSLVQKVKGDQETFGDISKTVFKMALRIGSESNRIDVVFDTYIEHSIKNTERIMRGSDEGFMLQNITASQIVRQWKPFLSKTANKTNLIDFFVNEWRKPEYKAMIGDKVMYVTTNDKCIRISSGTDREVPELLCKQEEADGRLFLHAEHASKESYSAIQICCDDTDVLIMALAFCEQIGVPMFIKCGSRTRTRLVDVKKIATTLGSGVCKALIGLHAFTGCDTVSAFAGKGKASALKFVKNQTHLQAIFQKLGEEWIISDDLMCKLEKFTCLLYAPKSSATSVNALRYDLFCAKRGEIESHQLPPCHDCLKKHSQRANYQAAIWRRCLEQIPEVPNPVGRGWKMEEREGRLQLVVHWMDVPPAPDAVLDLLSCNCTKRCTLPNCVCVANGLQCTDMCRLQSCENRAASQESDDEETVNYGDGEVDEGNEDDF